MDRFKTAICCMVKNELRFIREWAEYHLSIGFDKLFIIEDYGSNSHKEQLKGLDNVVIHPIQYYGVMNYDGVKTQNVLYKVFLDKCKEEGIYDYVLFTDVDEFLMFDEGYDLQRLCREYKDYSGVWIAWRLYNANGHVERPNGSVLESYTHSMPDGYLVNNDVRWNFKSLVNIHNATRFDTIHQIAGGVNTSEGKIEGINLCYDKAWINHYFSKSWEDYVDRMVSRGNMKNNYRTFDDFFDSNPEMVDRMEQLLNDVRLKRNNSTHYISKKYKLVSGGNKNIIDQMNENHHKIQSAFAAMQNTNVKYFE